MQSPAIGGTVYRDWSEPSGAVQFGRVLPASLAGLQLRHPLADAFLTGVLAVAVASPCTAPFMGARWDSACWRHRRWPSFAAIGIGMALPHSCQLLARIRSPCH